MRSVNFFCFAFLLFFFTLCHSCEIRNYNVSVINNSLQSFKSFYIVLFISLTIQFVLFIWSGIGTFLDFFNYNNCTLLGTLWQQMGRVVTPEYNKEPLKQDEIIDRFLEIKDLVRKGSGNAKGFECRNLRICFKNMRRF